MIDEIKRRCLLSVPLDGLSEPTEGVPADDVFEVKWNTEDRFPRLERPLPPFAEEFLANYLSQCRERGMQYFPSSTNYTLGEIIALAMVETLKRFAK